MMNGSTSNCCVARSTASISHHPIIPEIVWKKFTLLWLRSPSLRHKYVAPLTARSKMSTIQKRKNTNETQLG